MNAPLTGSLTKKIENLMSNNRREKDGHTYTVPSPELYPFQWLWDSCFHATILSYFDVDAARNELRSVTAKPLATGLLPHIIYWKDDYRVTNWGREMRGDVINGSWGTDGTSAITQPPLIATTLWNLHMRHPQNAFLYELYPILREYYLCLMKDRDPESTGLLGIINPDESGEDNSPRFDTALGLPPKHSDHENLDKRISLMEHNKACAFDAFGCAREHFWIKDVSFNAIFARSLESLSNIAQELGAFDDAEIFKIAATTTKEALRKQLCSEEVCYSCGGNEQTKIIIRTWNMFMPLFAGALDATRARKLIEQHLLNEDTFWLDYPVPSVAKTETAFSPENFWRGPTWMSVNWFIYKALAEYGYTDLAADIKTRSVQLIEQSGFREYYNPITGAGLGAQNFTWGGLVLDMT